MARTRSPNRRVQILDTAALVFARKGYHTATVSDVIEAAGIARGTFYLYFGSKRDLFAELLDRFLLALREGIRAIDVTSDVAPLDQLRRNLERTLDVVTRHRAEATLLLGSIEAPDRAVRTRVVEFFSGIKEMVESSIETGKAIGLVRDVPQDLAAHFVFGAAREVVAALVVQGKGAAATGSSLRRRRAVDIIEPLLDLVASGLLVGSPLPVGEPSWRAHVADPNG